MKSDNFIVIQGWMINELKLKGNALLVFALIYGFTRDGRTKFASGRQYIAESFNISLPTVDKALQELIDLGYIVKESCVNQADTDKYYANISSKETLVPENISSKETLHNIHSSSNNTNIQQSLFTDNTNKEELEVRNKMSDKVSWFIDTYNKICVSLPKCIRVTAKRSKAIVNILKKYSKEEIIVAFESIEASDFCKGRNDRGWKADIDFISREDKFVSALEGKYNGRRRRSVEEISDGPTYRVSKEEKEKMRKAVESGELEEY